jgi:Tfp pilus assembly PilM family ATPase
MFQLLKNRTYSIGMDMGDDIIKMVQLASNGKGISLTAGGCKHRPDDVKPGSSNWQRWAIEAICELTMNGKFRGRNVMAVMPANEVFIEHIKMPKIKDGDPNAKKGTWDSDDKLQDAIFSKIKQKLPFEPNDAMIKYIPAEKDRALVIASERKIIDRHLAIYEKANLMIKAIGVWPIALINSYTMFFGRRRADVEAIVMLLEMDANCTNVVICRHKDLLFARSIPIGSKHLETEEAITRLVLELAACKRHLGSMQRKAQIERLIFFSSQAESENICAKIAKQLEMPAQIGNCLAAVEIEDPCCSGIDRRDHQVNWATAFGLSLLSSQE